MGIVKSKVESKFLKKKKGHSKCDLKYEYIE